MMIHNHATQVLRHEVFIELTLLLVHERVVPVTLQDEDLSLSERFHTVSQKVIVCLNLAFELDLAIALKTWGIFVFLILILIPERLRNGLSVDSLCHDFLLEIG